MNLSILKRDNVKQIYKGVDAIMKKNGYEGYGVPKTAKQDAAMAAIMKMNRRDWFDVCTVNAIYDMFNIKISSDRQSYYRTLHCVHWGDMPNDTRELINAMILHDIRGEMIEKYVEGQVTVTT